MKQAKHGPGKKVPRLSKDARRKDALELCQGFEGIVLEDCALRTSSASSTASRACGLWWRSASQG